MPYHDQKKKENYVKYESALKSLSLCLTQYSTCGVVIIRGVSAFTPPLPDFPLTGVCCRSPSRRSDGRSRASRGPSQRNTGSISTAVRRLIDTLVLLAAVSQTLTKKTTHTHTQLRSGIYGHEDTCCGIKSNFRRVVHCKRCPWGFQPRSSPHASLGQRFPLLPFQMNTRDAQV